MCVGGGVVDSSAAGRRISFLYSTTMRHFKSKSRLKSTKDHSKEESHSASQADSQPTWGKTAWLELKLRLYKGTYYKKKERKTKQTNNSM